MITTVRKKEIKRKNPTQKTEPTQYPMETQFYQIKTKIKDRQEQMRSRNPNTSQQESYTGFDLASERAPQTGLDCS